MPMYFSLDRSRDLKAAFVAVTLDEIWYLGFLRNIEEGTKVGWAVFESLFL